MFLVELFTIAKIWKQPKCSSVDEWIKATMGHLHNGILVGHYKEGNLSLCNSMAVLGEHILSEISQSKRDKYYKPAREG